jgi:hypothetical protein
MLLRTFRSFLVQGSLGDVGIWIVDGDACRVKADTLPLCNGASFRCVIPVGGSVFRMAFLGCSLRRALCRCGLTVCQGKRVQRIHMHHPLIQHSRRRRLAGLAQALRSSFLVLTLRLSSRHPTFSGTYHQLLPVPSHLAVDQSLRSQSVLYSLYLY